VRSGLDGKWLDWNRNRPNRDPGLIWPPAVSGELGKGLGEYVARRDA
jgi:hypothetical protein